MFWPVISSTATTLCAFLPMLFWPGVPGQFMGMLPVTLIFVLTASLVVALIYLPIMGGVTGRLENWMSRQMEAVANLPLLLHLLLFAGVALLFVPAALFLAPSEPNAQGLLFQWMGAQFAGMDALNVFSIIRTFAVVFVIILMITAVGALALGGVMLGLICLFALLTRLGRAGRWLAGRMFRREPDRIHAGYRRNGFGHVMEFITGNPIMPLVMAGIVFIFVGTVLIYFSNNSKGCLLYTSDAADE